MPRERDGFREQLASVIAAFPDGECLHPADVAKYTGINRLKVTKKFPFTGSGRGQYITRTQLARLLTN